MNRFRRALAGCCIGVLLATSAAGLSACRPKDETAMTIDGVKITTGYYLACLVDATTQAIQQVNAAQSSSSTTTLSKLSDYYTQTINGVNFVTWVQNQALMECQTYVAVQKQFSAAKLTFSAPEETNLQSYVSMYWDTQGYDSQGNQLPMDSLTYAPNGVSKATYTEKAKSMIMQQDLFTHIYGAGGTSAISDADMKTGLKTHYALADAIVVSLTDSSGTALDDTKKAAIKTRLDGYVAELKRGAKFSDIQAKETAAEQAESASSSEPSSSSGSGSSAVSSVASGAGSGTSTSAPASSAVSTSSAASSAPVSSAVSTSSAASSAPVSSAASSGSGTSSAATSSGGSDTALTPQDSSARIFGGPQTSSPSDYFTDINGMATGDIKVLPYTDSYVLAVKKDILADPYYLTTLDSAIRYTLKGSTFTSDLAKAAGALTTVKNQGALNYYNPKRIVLPKAASGS